MSKLVLSLECTSGPIDLTPSIRFERQANHEACPAPSRLAPMRGEGMASEQVKVVSREELLQRKAALEAELHTIRNCRSEDELLDELDEINYLLGVREGHDRWRFCAG